MVYLNCAHKASIMYCYSFGYYLLHGLGQTIVLDDILFDETATFASVKFVNEAASTNLIK